MNKVLRKRLAEASVLLNEAMAKMGDAKSIFEEVRDEEDDKLGNLNEGQLAGPMGERLQETADSMTEQTDDLESQVDDLQTIIDSIDSIVGEVEGL